MVVIKGSHCSVDKIKFTGRTTNKSIVYKTSGNTYKEIYENLINMGVIDCCDYDPVDRYILDELNKTYADYTDAETDDIDFDQLYKDGEEFLTDEAYREIISGENGNAFYQEWETDEED